MHFFERPNQHQSARLLQVLDQDPPIRNRRIARNIVALRAFPRLSWYGKTCTLKIFFASCLSFCFAHDEVNVFFFKKKSMFFVKKKKSIVFLKKNQCFCQDLVNFFVDADNCPITGCKSPAKIVNIQTEIVALQNYLFIRTSRYCELTANI